MSEKSQLVRMAEYNELMNKRIIEASGNLTKEKLSADKGAFFKSVIGTLNHILIGDILWLKRFSTHPNGYKSLLPMKEIKKPERLDEIICSDLQLFQQERAEIDSVIYHWCNELIEEDLDKPLQYINYKGEAHNKRLGDLILHLFLHQVHHRGQVTTLLSQERIDFGETDLPEIIPDER